MGSKHIEPHPASSFIFSWLYHMAYRILVSRPESKPWHSAVNVQSPKHWTAKDFLFFFLTYINYFMWFKIIWTQKGWGTWREEEDEEGKGFLSMSWERNKARKMEDLHYRREMSSSFHILGKKCVFALNYQKRELMNRGTQAEQ